MGGRSGKTLTPKQVRYAQEYCIDRNKTRAAVRAGYAPAFASQQGPRLYSYADVRAEIDRIQGEQLHNCQVDAERIKRELMNMVSGRSTEYLNADGSIKPVDEWTPEMQSRMESYEVTAGDGHQDWIHKVKPYSKLEAIKVLSKIEGLEGANVNVNVYLEDQKALQAARPRIALAAKVREAFQAKHPELLAPRSRGPRDTHVIEGEPVDGEIVE